MMHAMHHFDALNDARLAVAGHGSKKTAEGREAITLRNLPEPVARAVRERAETYHVSLNKAVIGLLEEATGSGAAPARRYGDLDHLFGALSAEGAEAIERSVAEGRTIQPEEWT